MENADAHARYWDINDVYRAGDWRRAIAECRRDAGMRRR
jgi:hypothetical protein